MTKKEYTHPKRYRGCDLFSAILDKARENGDLADIDPILDYALPEGQGAKPAEDPALTRYEFDLCPTLNFGGSEGIYLDLYLHGYFDDTGREHRSIGTIKTLQSGLDACKRMGELAGILLHHEREFVNAHIDNFTPEAELERMWDRKHPDGDNAGEGA